jgi:diphthamide synthase (EF-2-diphthine--ammonia ligase)
MASSDIEELHRRACEAGDDSYIDPATSYQVMTARCHLKRGWCCGNGCRHCPFGHHNVKDARHRRNAIAEVSALADRSACRPGWPAALHTRRRPAHTPPPLPQPTLLRAGRGGASRAAACCDVAFFSGGKDSFLAAREAIKELQRSGRADKRVVLLTTFDAELGMHGLQRVELPFIQDQARLLGLDLIAVPVPKGGAGDQGAGYLGAVQRGLQLAPGRVERLVFGDLHLTSLRDWRAQSFGALGYTCHFPLWRRPYSELMALLKESGARVVVSAVQGPEVGVQEGDVFDDALLRRLPEGVDAFGERGEFHTRVHVNG